MRDTYGTLRDVGGNAVSPLPATVSGETVYHYTSATGLLGILNERCLWASSPLAMNDLSEIGYGLHAIEDAWKLRPKSDLTELQMKLMGEALGWTADALGPGIGEWVKGSIYFISASTDPDSLNQWQGYSGQRGYALGIDTGAPLAILEPQESPEDAWWRQEQQEVRSGWHRVLYRRDEQEAAIKDLLDFILDEVPDPEQRLTGYIYRRDLAQLWIGQLAALLKHETFKDEREIRYVTGRPPSLPEQYRSGRTGLVPYLELAATKSPEVSYQARVPATARRPLPITALICGPTNADERPLVQQVAAGLLRKHHFLIDPTMSESPYRF